MERCLLLQGRTRNEPLGNGDRLSTIVSMGLRIGARSLYKSGRDVHLGVTYILHICFAGERGGGSSLIWRGFLCRVEREMVGVRAIPPFRKESERVGHGRFVLG